MANQRKRSDDDLVRVAEDRSHASDDPGRARSMSAAELSEDTAKFEDQLENLENIVTRIDSGELALEESIEAFERGVGLVRSLNRKLDEVERRVEVLMRGTGGELQRTPYEGETGAADNGIATKKAEDEEVPF
jgi:exodeoxyribonuclease VII small subunit